VHCISHIIVLFSLRFNSMTLYGSIPEDDNKSLLPPPKHIDISSPSRTRMLMLCVLLLLTSVGNSVGFKRMTNHMPNYSFFLSQLINVIYVPIFFGLVTHASVFTNAITPSMRSFPKRKFLIMGFYDALSGLLMLFGGVYTSGSYQVNTERIPLASFVLLHPLFSVLCMCIPRRCLAI
jgi:hypothetical protein